ncbi:hypothetical protein D1007_61472 [Hordeum vulgare]|nr:hypothetical protein D1007_61472 [Hordeum vulgare]
MRRGGPSWKTGSSNNSGGSGRTGDSDPRRKRNQSRDEIPTKRNLQSEFTKSAGPCTSDGARTDRGEVSSPLKGKGRQENREEVDLRHELEKKREQDLRNKLHDQYSSSANYGGNRGERFAQGMISRSAEHRMDVDSRVGGWLGMRSGERGDRRRGTFVRKPRQIYREVQHGHCQVPSAGVGLKRRPRQVWVAKGEGDKQGANDAFIRDTRRKTSSVFDRICDNNDVTATPEGMGRTCVYVHHVDKDAFLKGNIDPDPDELDMVFDFCPSYAELLEQVRKDLNWVDPSDVVEFDGRHNVGLGMHIRWKTMCVNSEQCWLAYKDTVAESLDKALELFAIKTNVPNLHLDLNRVASPIDETSPPRINEEANIEPLSAQQSSIQHEPLLEDNDEHDDDENDGIVLHDNNLGDLDKYNLQETMDHSILYSCGYAFESDNECPDEEVDEEGFTAKEVEAFTKVLGWYQWTPLFEDLSLADEAVVDGGEGILFGVRPPSHRDKHGKNIILPGSKFQTFLELNMWLDEYSVTHYRPHKVVHSNMKLRYTVACEDSRCPWIFRARPWKGGPGWNIVSCMPHTCRSKRVDGKLSSQNHRQLTSEFIAYRLSNSISSLLSSYNEQLHRFARLYNALVANKKLDACGLEFLNRHIQLRPK